MCVCVCVQSLTNLGKGSMPEPHPQSDMFVSGCWYEIETLNDNSGAGRLLGQ